MQVFDRIDPGKLDQRDAELWVLALAMILVLGGGLALLMYPAAFSNPVTLSGVSVRGIFFGFCVLCVLLVGYLMEREFVLRHLRKQLEEERTRTTRLLSQASADLLDSLPGHGEFRARLELDFGRAAAFKQPLSVIVARLKASKQVVEAGETSTAYVDAVKAIIRKLRGADSIYLVAPSVLAIILPGVFGDHAGRIAERLAEGLVDAAGANNRFIYDLRIINYPEHTASAGEMEQKAESYFAGAWPQGQPV